MNIVVCLKQVPSTTEVKINPETNTLIREGIENVVNPFDAYGLEEGVRLKERYEGKVTALSMGPPQAEAILREAITLGADEALLLCDREFAGADTWATAYTLAAAVKKLGDADLVICGRQTVDGDTGQVGPEMAEMLDMPFIAYVSSVEEVSEGQIRAKRAAEDGYEEITAPLPAVITVSKEINTPRLPSLRGKARARSAEIPVLTAKTLGADPAKIGLSGSWTQVVKVFFPTREVKAEIFAGTPEEQVDALLGNLKKAGFLK
ncbi:electron transfer flavoprotein subunit beta/FixA family protein [Chloroflexota bacterium]